MMAVQSQVSRPRPTRRSAPHLNRGFTLVEVLVALFAMALLAALSWQGLDSVLRSRDASRDAIDSTVRLSTVITQWEQDLAALHDSEAVPALDFDGQSLRLTRRTDGGVQLVVWSLRGDRWLRWASPPQTQASAMQELWLRSQQFLGNEAGQLVAAEGAREWQIYFFRGGSWSNAQSSGDLATDGQVNPGNAAGATPPSDRASEPEAKASEAVPGSPAAPPAAAASVPSPTPAAAPSPSPFGQKEQLPAAVRLVIGLGAHKLTRDIVLEPGGS